MIPALIYSIGLTATFSYLVLSLRAMSISPAIYRASLRGVWVSYLITSAVWFLLLPFWGIYELVKWVGRRLGLYHGF